MLRWNLSRMNRNPRMTFTTRMAHLLTALVLFTLATTAGIGGEEAFDPMAMARAAMVEPVYAQHPVAPAIWPEAPPEARPFSAILIFGYIDLTVLRLRWDGKQAAVSAMLLGRTWFYNPHGECLDIRRIDVPLDQLLATWRASTVMRQLQPVPPPVVEDGEAIQTYHAGGITSSHAPSGLLVYQTDDGGWADHHSPRSRRLDDQNRINVTDAAAAAAHRILVALVPRRHHGEQVAQPPEDLVAEWRALLPVLGDRLAPGMSEASGSKGSLLGGALCRMAAQIGTDADLPLLEKVEAVLSPGTYVSETLIREASMARDRIALRTAWDESRAIAIIAGNPRALHAQNDHALAIRRMWQNHDPVAYRAWIDATLVAATETGLLADQLLEIDRLGVGPSTPAIVALLGHDDPRIAIGAAAILLRAPNPGDWGIRPWRYPVVPMPTDDIAKQALATVLRIARDPSTDAPRHPTWPQFSARVAALSLASAVPEGVGLDALALRAMLDDPDNDGLAVDVLIDRLGLRTAIDPRTLKPILPGNPVEIAAWRRVLARGSVDAGIITACERLAALRDEPSRAQITALIAALVEESSRGSAARSARFLWLSRDMVWSIEAALKAWTEPPP
jgi:hypothetical protein